MVKTNPKQLLIPELSNNKIYFYNHQEPPLEVALCA